MLQEAIITKTFENGLAEVVVERSGICGGNCDECDGCRYENVMKSTVRNPINAHRGQHVFIETPTLGVYKGAFAIYVIPIVMLIAGYYIAALFTENEGVCIIAAFVATAVGILIARTLSKRSFKGDPVPSQIVSVISQD